MQKTRVECLRPCKVWLIAQVVETDPYESLSHASLAWLKSNLALCDVVHVHEWGGVFVDVITASAYRQLKPGTSLSVVVPHACSLLLHTPEMYHP